MLADFINTAPKENPRGVGRAGIMSVALAGAPYFKTISVNG